MNRTFLILTILLASTATLAFVPTGTAYAASCLEKIWIVREGVSPVGVYAYVPCGSSQRDLCVVTDGNEMCYGVEALK